MSAPLSAPLKRIQCYALALILGVILVRSTPTAAQESRHFENEAVIVLLNNSDISSANAAMFRQSVDGRPNTRWTLRFPSGKYRNVIALRSSTATSGLLLESMRALQEVQASRGVNPAHAEVLAITATFGDAPDKSTRVLFESLKRASEHEVPRLGKVRAISVRLR